MAEQLTGLGIDAGRIDRAAGRTVTSPPPASGKGFTLRYLSVCSGIEAASVAWEPLGWECVGVSEIEKFPSAVLAYRYPDVPNFGDFTTIQKEDIDGPVDLLVGGTPCQSFSVAGLRRGMDDDRGNLALQFVELAYRLGPVRYVVWENVFGVLSSAHGRDFASFLSGLSGRTVTVPEGGWRNSGIVEGAEGCFGLMWRTLDAEYLRVESHPRAVPQRRRRVFVVGYLGDWRRAAAVLLERESLFRHPEPRRESGTRVAALTACGVGASGADDNQAQAGHLIPEVAHTLRGEGFDGSEDGTGRGVPLVMAPAFSKRPWQQIATRDDGIDKAQNGIGVSNDGTAYTLDTHATQGIATAYVVRKLTPLECELLMGLQGGWTDVPYRGKQAADGPRYKAIGNSFAVNVVSWIGRRIAEVDAL